MDAGKKMTMRDVAKLANVSVSSVSRYLTDPKAIQPRAAYSIKSAIQELNYQPNLLARNLKQNRSNTIGLIVPYVDYTFGTVCSVAGDFFFERKYVVFTCQTDNDPDKERYYVQSLLSQAAAGLIIAPCGMNTTFLRGIARNYSNIVVLDRREDIGCDIVAMDYEACSYRLARYALEKYLCDGVSVFFGADHSCHTRDSLTGLRRAFQEMGADFSKAKLTYNCHRVEYVLKATHGICKNLVPGKRPVILALGTAFTEYAVIALNQFGGDALQKVDLLGFATQRVADRLNLTIPCVLQDPEDAGVTVCQVLLDKITGQGKPNPDGSPKTYELKPRYSFP